ncbi:SDR family NAD(P)-dependent oxidoreductase [Nocardia sp. NPDC004750]
MAIRNRTASRHTLVRLAIKTTHYRETRYPRCRCECFGDGQLHRSPAWPIIGSRLALKRMLPRRSGHLVDVASAAGRVPQPGSAVHTATKFGVVGLTKALRLVPGQRCALQRRPTRTGSNADDRWHPPILATAGCDRSRRLCPRHRDRRTA